MKELPRPSLRASRAPAPLAGLSLLIGLAPLIIWPGLHSFSLLPQQIWLVLGGGGLLIWLALRAWAEGRFWRPTGALSGAVALWWAWVLMAGLFGPIKPLVGGAIFNWLILPLIFYAAATLVCSEAEGRILLMGPALGLGLVAALGLLQAAGLVRFIPQIIPPAATLANKNPAAHIIAAGLPWAVYLFWASRGPRKLAWGGVILILAGYLAAAKSVTGAAAALTGLAVALAWARPGRIFIWGLVLWLVILAAGVGWLMHASEPLSSLKPSQSGLERWRQSALVRRLMWLDALKLWRSKPLLGHGPGHFGAVAPLVHAQVKSDPVFNIKVQPRRAHNDFLHLAAETGLGGALWAVVFLTAFLTLGRSRAGPAPWLAGALSAWGLISFFSFPLSLPSATAHLGLNLGLAAGLSSPARAVRRPWAWTLGLGAFALLILAAGVGVLLTQVRADWRLAQGQALARSKGMDKAWGHLERAAALNVWSEGAPFALAVWRHRCGQLSKAEEAYHQVLELAPRHPNALYNLGLIHLARGQPGQALHYAVLVERALFWEPQFLRLLWGAHSALRDWPRAIEVLKRLLQVRPWDKEAWHRLGWTQYQRGHFAQAIEALEEHERLAAHYGGSPEVRALLAEARRKLAEEKK